MALYMYMARYTPEAVKAMMHDDSDREAMVRATVEGAGGKLLGFYGLIGQDYHVAVIADMPGVGEFVGVVVTATLGGAIAAHKTIPLYSMSETAPVIRETHAKLTGVYKPPGG